MSSYFCEKCVSRGYPQVLKVYRLLWEMCSRRISTSFGHLRTFVRKVCLEDIYQHWTSSYFCAKWVSGGYVEAVEVFILVWRMCVWRVSTSLERIQTFARNVCVVVSTSLEVFKILWQMYVCRWQQTIHKKSFARLIFYHKYWYFWV